MSNTLPDNTSDIVLRDIYENGHLTIPGAVFQHDQQWKLIGLYGRIFPLTEKTQYLGAFIINGMCQHLLIHEENTLLILTADAWTFNMHLKPVTQPDGLIYWTISYNLEDAIQSVLWTPGFAIENQQCYSVIQLSITDTPSNQRNDASFFLWNPTTHTTCIPPLPNIHRTGVLCQDSDTTKWPTQPTKTQILANPSDALAPLLNHFATTPWGNHLQTDQNRASQVTLWTTTKAFQRAAPANAFFPLNTAHLIPSFEFFKTKAP
jgi:hypothetical protein